MMSFLLICQQTTRIEEGLHPEIQNRNKNVPALAQFSRTCVRIFSRQNHAVQQQGRGGVTNAPLHYLVWLAMPSPAAVSQAFCD